VTVSAVVETEVTVSVAASSSATAAVGKATVAAAPVLSPTLSLRLSATRIKAGRNVTFTGTTDRRVAGATIYRQSYYGGAWHTRQTGKVGANGVATFTVKPLTKSTGTYRLVLAAGPSHRAAASPSVVLRTV
jgi:plastocyanin